MTILSNEIALPAYNGMTDAQILTSLRVKNIPRDKSVMTGKEIFAQQNSADYAALSDAKKQQWISLTSHDGIDPFGPAVQVVLDIWGGGSTTISNLQSARVELISRAQELGLGLINEGDVKHSRAI